MINRNIKNYLIISVLLLSALSFTQGNVFAPSTIDMGTASNYAILSGSVITLGVHNQPVTGNTGHVSTLSDNFTYTGLPLGTDNNATTVGTTGTLGTPLGDEHAALVNIGTVGTNGTNATSTSGLACTFSFANGAINLNNDTTHPTGIYTPGVYCINGAVDIGTSGITLTGNGQHIFKISGALTSTTGSHVVLSGGALASDVFWAPSSASLGANTSFQGTILTGPGAITLGADSDLNQGRLVSESAITIEGGIHTITVPGGTTLSSIAITTPATKLSYTVGQALNTTGLVVTGTFSDLSTSVVTPTSITGFDSSVPVNNQVLTIHVGTQTTTYTISVSAPITLSLGTASNYAILSGSVITLNVPGQLVTGNTGHVSTLSANFTYGGLPLGTDHAGVTVGTITSPGTPLGDEHIVLDSIGTWNGVNSTGLACTFTFAPGAIDLAVDTTHGPIGVYTSGVYCINGGASIGTAGITLSGNGYHIFKINGALTSDASSQVALSGGALSNNVFWAPSSASLGANTSFQGTILTGPGAITLGAVGDLNQGRLISESAVTIESAGPHVIIIPGGVAPASLSSIAITTPATKLSYTVGDSLNTTGLVVTGTFSDNSTSVVTPTSITGFDSSVPVNTQIITIHVGSKTATYPISVSAPVITINLGTASTFGILASTLTNTAIGVNITGDVGYTTAPATLPTISGSLFVAPNSTYSQAGVDQGTALTALNALACTFTFAPGAIDLAADTTHGPIGVYTPGVYCIAGAQSVGTAGITLNGAGTYVFRSTGALNTVANSHVTLIGGADALKVFWTPVATTLGANSVFVGTDIDNAAITMGANATWLGRALDFATTVTIAQSDKITVPTIIPDTTNPTVFISSPLSGSVINQVHFAISGNASDNVSVDHVIVTVDGTPVTVTGTNNWSTDSGSLSSGVHTIIATSFDTSGNSDSQTIHVTVSTIIINTNSTSIASATGAGPISSVTDIGHFVSFVPVSESTLPTAGKPAAETFPYGFSSFQVTGLTSGQTIHVTQTYPQVLPADTKYWKIENGVWTDATSLITSISGHTLTLAITDGGFGDADGLANGSVTDPGGIGIPFSASINLGAASTFGILASTYTNTAIGVNVTGDVGYTTPPAVAASVTGTIHVADLAYSQAGTAQGIALPALNALACTFTFAPGAIDLSNDTTHGPLGVYTPGVYCIAGAQSVGTAGITLNGSGTYVFRSTGALNTVVNSHVTLTGGADASNVFWTPVATTLGANSVFVGTDIDNAAITMGANATWLGRALDFATTVTTSLGDKITVPATPLDTTAPVITLIGPSTETITVGGTYTELGATVVDPDNSGLNATITGTVNTAVIGTYTITYSATDPAGNVGTPATRTVFVVTALSATGNLGTAGTFGILASTYTNTATGIIINGDLGYTTGPAVAPIVFGTTYMAPNSIYSQAGTDEGTALTALNALACTSTFGGATDLSLLPQPLAPGIYCITGAPSIGTGGITLNGAGSYVFRSTGALNTVVNSHVTLTGGAQASDVFWTPGAATTLGANSVFAGTDIDDSGITIGSTVTWMGRALAFGGIVSTDGDTITTPPTTPVTQITYSFPSGSGSNSPSESKPSLGGVTLQTFSDGLRINGHVFDVSKFYNPVPQQVLPLDKPVTITIKQTMTRGSQTWQHVMLFMNFGGKYTTTGNADTWMILDKTNGVQVHDPNGFITNVGAHNDFTAYGMNTTFAFTPVKQMSDSNMIIRVWDNRLSQTDANVMGALVFGTVPTAAAPIVKPDWIQVFTNLKDADNAVESAGYLKPEIFGHISTVQQVWTQPNTGHVTWFFDTKDVQAALYIYDSADNVVGQMIEPLVKNPAPVTGKDTSYAGNHLSVDNTDAMTKALAQQQLNAQKTMNALGYSP